MTVAGKYTHAEEDRTITTTVTWEGDYRIGDSANWYPVLGCGTTFATSVHFETFQYWTYVIAYAKHDGPGPGRRPLTIRP